MNYPWTLGTHVRHVDIGRPSYVHRGDWQKQTSANGVSTVKSRFFKTVLLAGVIIGGIWILSNRDQIRKPGDVVNLVKEQFSTPQVGFAPQAQNWPDTNPQPPFQQAPIQPSSQFVTNVVRIASFKLNESIAEIQSESELDLVADICRRYDAIAFQEIGADDDQWLARLTDRMNAVGAASLPDARPTRQLQSDYFYISDRSSEMGQSARSITVTSAIVFNRRTLELDQSQWYTVKDPDQILSRQPLVACFRTRGPAPDQAFTFSLVNVKFDGNRSARELAYLGELFRAIRDDGRGEDDVLIVGDFHAGDRELQPMRKRAGLTWVVSNRPTNTLNTSQFDNLVFNDVATVEFTGRGGVFDFMRHYNLRLDDALRISEHMPVWAEFSVFEGGARTMPRFQSQNVPGRVADGELSKQR